MKFLIDRCAGRLLADWLRKQGHDVVESRELGPDPGDRALLDCAAKETRILITIDTDFGELIYVDNLSHAGLIRLPDIPARERQLIIHDLFERSKAELGGSYADDAWLNKLSISAVGVNKKLRRLSSVGSTTPL